MASSLPTPPTSPLPLPLPHHMPGTYPTPSLYTYLYPDNHPSIFVAILGSGSQGTAVLVRSLINSELYARKRVRRDPRTGRDLADETLFALPHPNIPAVISQTTFPCRYYHIPEGGIERKATLWAYANGGDLCGVVGRLRCFGHFTPELLVWHLIKQLLETVLYLHDHDVAHGDLIPDNIFVHWIESTDAGEEALSDASGCALPQILPNFLVGDFGHAISLSPGVSGTLHEHGFLYALQATNKDILSVAAVVAYAMNGSDFQSARLTSEARKAYSSELIQVFDILVALPRRFQRFRYSQRFGHNRMTKAKIRDEILHLVDSGFKNCKVRSGDMGSSKTIFATPKAITLPIAQALKVIRPRHIGHQSLQPWGHPSREALLKEPYRPPGPWCVAEIDSVTGQLRSVNLEEIYCAEEAMVTGERGEEVDGENVRAFSGLPCR